MGAILFVIGIILTVLILDLYTTNASFYASVSFSNMLLRLIENSNPILVYAIIILGVAIANASIILFIPYPILIIYAIQAGENPILITLLASIGAAVGEMSSYLVGKLGRGITNTENKNYIKIQNMLNQNKKKVYFIVFLFALTPLPDDLVLVPLGLMNFGFAKSFIPCFLGKLVLILIIVLFSNSLTYVAGNNLQVLLDLLTIWLIIGMIVFARRINEQ